MKVYVAYYYFSGWQSSNGRWGSCERYQLMGIFSTYERAYESFREKYDYYIADGNMECYEIYVDKYGAIRELTLDELLNRDEVTIY